MCGAADDYGSDSAQVFIVGYVGIYIPVELKEVLQSWQWHETEKNTFKKAEPNTDEKDCVAPTKLLE